MARLIIEMTLMLLFAIPDDNSLERGEGLDKLQAWHEQRYEAYNVAEDNLWRADLIRRMHHGQGVTYYLTTTGQDAKLKIKHLLGL